MCDITTNDYIKIDRQIMLDFHGKYVFIFGSDRLDLFETESVRDLTTHPILGKQLSKETIQYIKLYAECYDSTKNMPLSSQILQQFFTWYDERRKAEITVEQLKTDISTYQAYNIVRLYMTATDFQDHFINFNVLDSDQERYERHLAEKALNERKRVGTWLLRHSSFNRPSNEVDRLNLWKRGVRYYALSYIDNNGQIQHILLTHQVGKGWKYSTHWFSNFLDCLEFTLNKNKLPYYKRIGKYIQDI